jgi:Holliday junction DNA helicase RuvA
MIAQVAGRLAAKQADRVMILTAAGVGYEIVVPLSVMERLPAAGEAVSLATELVVREDGWSLYGFSDEAERRFFQRLIGVSGVGPKIAIALMSALGVERGVRALRERNIALLASVSGIGKKTAERLALELTDKLGEFEAAAASPPWPEGGWPMPPCAHWSGSATRARKRTGRSARRSPRTAGPMRRRWSAAPSNSSPTDDHGDRRVDLYPLRVDEPTARARRRDTRCGRVRHVPHAA